MAEASPTLKDLKEATAEFFRRHWPAPEVDPNSGPPPEWMDGWRWQGSVPYHDQSGVYALVDSSGVVMYVGLGASLGTGRYLRHGLSRRLSAHVITQDKSRGRGFYLPRPKWSAVDSISTIGMPPRYSYLSAALEDFLISALKPPRNIAKRPSQEEA
jgi:hypothetical protein